MKRTMMSLAMVAAVSLHAIPADWYVDGVNGDDAYDGTSAETAKKRIQSAIDLAGSGDTVHVAPGRYNDGSAKCQFNNVTARVVITNKINLVATGKKTETFIDGGGEMRCIYIYRNGNTYKAADNTVIRGFTVCNGSAPGSSDYGAGVYLSKSYLVDCVVSNNYCGNRGGGSIGGTAIRCLYVDNKSDNVGSAAYETSFLNSVIAFQRGNSRLLASKGTVVNCTIVGNNTSGYIYSTEQYHLFNTIYVDDSKQSFPASNLTVASNCVFSAGTTGWSESLCGNISTEYPGYCFAAPALGDWRPMDWFGIANHGDAALLTKISLPTALAEERYVDYDGKPIPQTGSITCGAVQEICTESRALLKFPAGFEVEGCGVTPTVGSAAANRYAWVGSPGAFKVRKSGVALKDVMWYSLSTNGAFMTNLMPDTNNWVVVPTLSSMTNEIAAVSPAKTFYVDAARGNDAYANSDLGTAEHPYATIQAAIDAAPNGDKNDFKCTMILVGEGKYASGGSGRARLDVSNRVNNVWQYKNFRIVSEKGPEKTFIIGATGEGDDGCGAGSKYCCYSGLPTLVQGFTLTGGHGGNIAVYNSNGIGNAFLSDCIVTNNCGGEATICRVTATRCRIAGNKLTASGAGNVKDSMATMCEIVQSQDSAAGSYAVSGNSYVHFSAVKGACQAVAHFYASMLDGGQVIGQSGGYARYCFAHGDPLVAYTGSASAIQGCQNGRSRCRSFDGGDFHLRSDSPAIGMVTFSPDDYYAAFTFDMDGNLPPLDTVEGWTAGPRQNPTWLYKPHGIVVSFQ